MGTQWPMKNQHCLDLSIQRAEKRKWSSQSLVGVYTLKKTRYFKIEITHTVKSTLLKYNSVVFHQIHEVMQPSLLSNSRTLLSIHKETLHSFAAPPYLQLSPDLVLIYFLGLWIYLFCTLPINGIINLRDLLCPTSFT